MNSEWDEEDRREEDSFHRNFQDMDPHRLYHFA